MLGQKTKSNFKRGRQTEHINTNIGDNGALFAGNENSSNSDLKKERRAKKREIRVAQFQMGLE